MNIIKYFLSFLLNESGKGGGGGGSSTTTTKQAPLTAEEKALNEMQIKRTKEQVEREKSLAPARSTAMDVDIALQQQKIATQQAGVTGVQKYLTETDLTKAREQLRNEIIQDFYDKQKGKKSYVSDQEKEKLKKLETSYKTKAGEGISGLSTEVLNKLQGIYSNEGLLPSNLYKRLIGEETGRQLATTGRAGEMLSANTLMKLPAENRLRLANQYESSARLGLQEQAGRWDILGTAAGGSTGGAGTTSGITGTGGSSLSGTLAKLEAARNASATQTTSASPLSNSDMATQGALSGAQAGLGIGSGIGAGVGALAGAGFMGATTMAGAVAAGAATGGLALLIGGALYGGFAGYNA